MFLQWALPKLGLRWTGFRRVRGQVCKRLERRIKELALDDAAAYRRFLAATPAEWTVLGQLCRVTISRFYRDRGVYDNLTTTVLPRLAEDARSRGVLRLWSAGCASGEEPYTLSLIWHHCLLPRFPELDVHILATDTDEVVLQRALRGCYPPSSLQDLPPPWRERDFLPRAEEYCLAPRYRQGVDFRRHDVRSRLTFPPFDMILCRNLAFTYFDEECQRAVLQNLRDALLPHGILVIGIHETLPTGTGAFAGMPGAPGVYRKDV